MIYALVKFHNNIIIIMLSMQDSLSLSVEGLYELSVKLPAPVSEEKTKAAFKPKTGTLSITMPCF